MIVLWVIVGVAAALVGLVALSYLIEGLRRSPASPDRLRWAPDVPIRRVAVDGTDLRYVAAGDGPPLVLLHTLRTQLDLFQDVFAALAADYRVYAVDYPGHGFSDIPRTSYTPEMFARSVRGFLEAVGVTGAVIVGESIGGALGLLLAAEHHPAVGRVVAINSYDYGRGGGIKRGGAIARVLFTLSNVPILGATLWRFRFPAAFRLILRGSVHDRSSLRTPLVREMHDVGNRSGHYRAFMSLIRHFPKWEELRAVYGEIDVPVLLVYGEHDWSRPDERAEAERLIPTARTVTVPGAGHLLSLEAPDETIRVAREFAKGGLDS